MRDEEISELIESSDSKCGPEGDGDEINSCFMEAINKISQSGYYDEDAEEILFDFTAKMIEEEVLPDTPDVIESVELKKAWISKFNYNFWDYIKNKGIEIDE